MEKYDFRPLAGLQCQDVADALARTSQTLTTIAHRRPPRPRGMRVVEGVAEIGQVFAGEILISDFLVPN